MRSSVIELKR